MKLVIAALLMGAAAGQAIADDELTGTPYTVLYRGGAGSADARPLQNYRVTNPYVRQQAVNPQRAMGVMRLVDTVTRRELVRAAYDEKLGGYMFQMPFTDAEARSQRCLALVDARNQYVTVRARSALDNGTGFRNLAWEAELSRTGDLAALRAERAAVDAQAQSAGSEILRLQTESGLPPGASAAECPTPPAQPDPPRPQVALEPANVAAIAGPSCALRWEREHGSRVDLGRMFADGGAAADWQNRAEAAIFVDGLPGLRVPISGQDLGLVLDAAVKGRTYLEHGDGVRVFVRAQAACREEVGRQVSAVRQAWERAVAETRQAPQRARQQCAQKIARIAQLQTAQAAAPSYLAALDKRIAQQSSPPPAGDAVLLSNQLCQP